jgi:hypothetical protein
LILKILNQDMGVWLFQGSDDIDLEGYVK